MSTTVGTIAVLGCDVSRVSRGGSPQKLRVILPFDRLPLVVPKAATFRQAEVDQPEMASGGLGLIRHRLREGVRIEKQVFCAVPHGGHLCFVLLVRVDQGRPIHDERFFLGLPRFLRFCVHTARFRAKSMAHMRLDDTKQVLESGRLSVQEWPDGKSTATNDDSKICRACQKSVSVDPGRRLGGLA